MQLLNMLDHSNVGCEFSKKKGQQRPGGVGEKKKSLLEVKLTVVET